MKPDMMYQMVLENLSDGVYFVDRDRKILYWNRGAEEITGYKRDDVVGTHCWDNILMHIDEQGRSLCKTTLCPLLQAIETEATVETEAYLRHRDGHRLPVLIRSAATFDEQGHVAGAVETFTDNSSNHNLREKVQSLQNEALVDPLTGLPNRRHLRNTLETRFDELKRYGWPFALIFLDVDDFKQVNDTHGHDAGDEVLRMIARTLFTNSRSFDMPGRWGGEEFLVVCQNVTMAQLARITERYRLLVGASQVTSGNTVIRVTISAGATLARPDEDTADLVDRADQLMYKSKQSGKNWVTIE